MAVNMQGTVFDAYLFISVCCILAQLSLYAKLSSHILAIRERERENGSKHARNCVYLSKIE